MTNTSHETICHDLKSFLADNVLAEGVSIDASTNLSDVGIDSFSLVEIILFIERRFGITLPEEELNPQNLATINTLATCLEQHLTHAPN